jgi:crossover junction endodeoxyribonuclease RusA
MTTQAESIDLLLPWPPSLNGYYRMHGGRMLISEKGRHYRSEVIVEVLQVGSPRITGRLSLRLSVFPPDDRNRDLDNLAKGLLDALQHANVYDSDSQIDRLLIERCSIVEGGAVKVSISEITT